MTQGQVATFSVLVAGIPAFAYQWLYGTAALADATNDALVFPSADPTNAGSYRVVVTNAYASLTSAPAVLTIVASPLSITTQPQSLSVTQGQAATFDVVVSGIPPFHYQWWLDTAELLDATNSTLSFVSTDQTIQGTYRVVITNAYLAVTSAPAALVVTAPSPLAASQPVLTLTLAAQGAELLVTCRGAPGQVYHVLSTTRLDAHAAWETVATNTLPAAGMMTWAPPRLTNGAVYFRATLP